MYNKNFISLFLVLGFLCSAQSPDLRPDLGGMRNDHNIIKDYANNWKNNVTRSVDMDELKKTTSGTPYYDVQFYQGYLSNGVRIPDLLRYNAFSDQMEFLKENVTYEINKIKNLEIKFPEAKKTYIIEPIMLDNKEVLIYLLEIKKGKFSLYEKQNIKLTGGTGGSNGLVDNTSSYFSPKKSDYYIITDGKIIAIPKNAEELIKNLNTSSIDKSFFKSKKINLKDKDDLILLINHLNQ